MLESFIFVIAPESRWNLILSLVSRKATLKEDHFMAALWLKHIRFHLLQLIFKGSKPTIEDFYKLRIFCFRFVRNSFKKSIFSECLNHSAAMKWSSYKVAFLETKLKIKFHRDSGAITKMKDSSNTPSKKINSNKPSNFYLNPQSW